MDPFSSFFTPALLFYSFAIFAITYVFRIIIEYCIKGAPNSNVWNHLLLPLIPLCVGAISAVFAKMYPDPLGTSIFAREAYGLTAGLLSGLVYKMLKGYIKAQFPSVSLASPIVATAPPPLPGSIDSDQVASGMAKDVHPKL